MIYLPYTGVYRHRRTAATHVLVIMISTEYRSKKPYALPVQCLSYTGMSVSDLRQIINNVVLKMKEVGMQVTGIYV